MEMLMTNAKADKEEEMNLETMRMEERKKRRKRRRRKRRE